MEYVNGFYFNSISVESILIIEITIRKSMLIMYSFLCVVCRINSTASSGVLDIGMRDPVR